MKILIKKFKITILNKITILIEITIIIKMVILIKITILRKIDISNEKKITQNKEIRFFEVHNLFASHLSLLLIILKGLVDKVRVSKRHFESLQFFGQ